MPILIYPEVDPPKILELDLVLRDHFNYSGVYDHYSEYNRVERVRLLLDGSNSDEMINESHYLFSDAIAYFTAKHERLADYQSKVLKYIVHDLFTGGERYLVHVEKRPSCDLIMLFDDDTTAVTFKLLINGLGNSI
jgi:hypothetical protein